MKITRGSRFVAILGALALVATACTSAADTTTTEGVAPTDPPADVTTTTEEPGGPPEAGPLGAVTVAAGELIQIRSLQAISGPVTFLGVPNQRAIESAVDDYGPIGGHDVTIGTGLDDTCSSEGGQAAAQTIVADEQVVGVIGTSCSSAAVAAMPLISAAGMVMISSSNTSPALTSDLAGTAGTDYSPGYYRTAHNDLFQGQAVAKFLYNDLGYRTVAAIHDGTSYTQGLAQAMADAFTALGGTVTTFVGVNVGDTDMAPVLSEIAQTPPEALYFPIFQPEGDFLIQQFGSIAGLENTQLVGADGVLTSTFLALPESEGLYFSGPNLNFGENASDHTGVTATAFLAAYNTEHGEAPSAAFWAHSYDATTMLLTAIEEVAVELDDGSLFIDRQALRDALQTATFSGMTGRLICDDFGDCGSQEIQIVHHTDTSVTDATQLDVVFRFSKADLD